MDRLFSMTIFAKAVELGTFSAAADFFRISPQLVGKHIKMLEQQLGVRLLNRTTRRQHLTEIGIQYYEKVKIILSEVEAAEGLAAQTKSTPRGRLRVNAPVTFGIYALIPKLVEYMQTYPEVQVEVALTNRYVDAIEAGADVVFRVGELSDSSQVARRLAAYRLILCAAPAYLQRKPPIHTPLDLSQHECLNFSYTELRTHWTFDGPDGVVTVPVTGQLMVDSGEALLMAARAGIGLLLQPAELLAPEITAGRLVQVLPKYTPLTRSMHLLYAQDRQMTPKLRTFIEFAVTHFGSHNAIDDTQIKAPIAP